MKEIVAYETKDGRVYTDKEAALKVERMLEFEEAIYKFADHNGAYEEKDVIYKTIVENIEELQQIFDKLRG